jgi:hypothetical protein
MKWGNEIYGGTGIEKATLLHTGNNAESLWMHRHRKSYIIAHRK